MLVKQKQTTMSLKRGRTEMGTIAPNKVAMKKKVQFCDDIISIASSIIDFSAEEIEALWYTPTELTEQLDQVKALWISKDYAVLLRNSYIEPHISAQEYLNAFVSLPLRGLENKLANDLGADRAETRKFHVDSILLEQAVSYSLPTDLKWDKLYQTGRQTSSSSKLFAMRMGRADARVVELGDNLELAHEIVEEIRVKDDNLQRYKNRVLHWSSTYSLSPLTPAIVVGKVAE